MDRHPVGIRSVKLGSELVIDSPTEYSCFFNFFVKEKDKKVKKIFLKNTKNVFFFIKNKNPNFMFC